MSPFEVTVTRMTEHGKEVTTAYVPDSKPNEGDAAERVEQYVMDKLTEDPDSIVVVGPHTPSFGK